MNRRGFLSSIAQKYMTTVFRTRKKKNYIKQEILFKVDLAFWFERRNALRIKERWTNSHFPPNV